MPHQLRAVRESLGLTRSELAELSNISICTISRIESGDTTFKVNEATADAIAKALYVEIQRIFDTGELSHLGRPPHTGAPLRLVRSNEVICGNCHLAAPKRANCIHCDTPLTLAG